MWETTKIHAIITDFVKSLPNHDLLGAVGGLKNCYTALLKHVTSFETPGEMDNRFPMQHGP